MTPAAEASAASATVNGRPALDSAVRDKIRGARARLHEAFGKVALVMMTLPRYRHLSIADLQSLALDPLMRDRIALAAPAKDDGAQPGDMTSLAIWASVSEEVDAKIREQIKAGVFPIRLKPDEWTSGSINWLLDVIAPNQKLATAVIGNFKQVIKQGDLRIHPLVTRQVDPEVLKKMGATPVETPPGTDTTAGNA